MESIGKIAKFQTKTAKARPNSHLHSPAHVLADELSLKLRDKKHFALYLGMAKKFDHQYLRKILGEVMESRDVKTPGKLFTFLVKKNNQENKS